jgi:hypothetical protein
VDSIYSIRDDQHEESTRQPMKEWKKADRALDLYKL